MGKQAPAWAALVTWQSGPHSELCGSPSIPWGPGLRATRPAPRVGWTALSRVRGGSRTQALLHNTCLMRIRSSPHHLWLTADTSGFLSCPPPKNRATLGPLNSPQGEAAVRSTLVAWPGQESSRNDRPSSRTGHVPATWVIKILP